MSELKKLQESVEILRRAEMLVWHGQVCPAVRELGKLYPLVPGLDKHQELIYRIGFNLRDGRQPDAHRDIVRLRDKLWTEIGALGGDTRAR